MYEEVVVSFLVREPEEDNKIVGITNRIPDPFNMVKVSFQNRSPEIVGRTKPNE